MQLPAEQKVRGGWTVRVRLRRLTAEFMFASCEPRILDLMNSGIQEGFVNG